MIISMLSRRVVPVADAPDGETLPESRPDLNLPTGPHDSVCPAEAAPGPAPRLDFAARDPLGLATDPGLIAAAAATAARALAEHGARGAGPTLTERLEAALADLVGLGRAAVLPNASSGGAAAIRALVGRGDHVLIDNLANRALQAGAEASGADVHRYPTASVASVARWLEAVRANSPRAGILIATESLAPRGGEGPDLAALQALARRHEATLLVELGCDLGAMGEGGGRPDALALRGGLDVVAGQLSTLGGVHGGFAATARPDLAAALASAAMAEAGTDAGGLPPLAAAMAFEAARLLRSPEGARRRDRLVVNACALALGLRGLGLEVAGAPAPVLHVPFARRDLGRRMGAWLAAQGVAAEVVEGAGGDRAACRWRLRVTAGHERAEIEALVALAAEARVGVEREAEREENARAEVEVVA